MCMRYVYSFNEGSKEMKSLLGGKGANLAEMTKIGLPVPPGFTITTKACNDYYENNKTIKQEIIDQIEEKLLILEKDLNKKLGSEECHPVAAGRRRKTASGCPTLPPPVRG